MRKNTAFLALCRVNLTHPALYSGRKEAPAWIKSGSERFSKRSVRKKGLTQEQLAEKLAVSGRTVSRWETGSNMPDIGMLVVLADFYGVSIPELINGERKSENMNQETRDTAIAMAEYSQVTAKKQQAESHWHSVYNIWTVYHHIGPVHLSQREQLGEASTPRWAALFSSPASILSSASWSQSALCA